MSRGVPLQHVIPRGSHRHTPGRTRAPQSLFSSYKTRPTRSPKANTSPSKAMPFIPFTSKIAFCKGLSTDSNYHVIVGITWLFQNYHVISYEVCRNYHVIVWNYLVIWELPPYFLRITTLFPELPPYWTELPPYFRN